MKPPSYEDILQDPELLHEMMRAAHRERSVAIGRLFARLFSALKPTGKTAPHAARTRFAA